MRYKKLANDTYVVEDKNKIIIRLDDNHKIKIHVELINKTIDWSFLNELKDNEIKQTLKINETLELMLNFKYMKKEYDIEHLNPVDWKKMYKKLSRKDPKLISSKKIYSDNEAYWKNHNWFTALQINNLFYETVDELVKYIYKFTIETFDDYELIAKKNDKIPLDIMELYDINFDKLLDIIILYRKSKNGNKVKKNLAFIL